MSNLIIEQIWHDETNTFCETTFEAESEYAKVKSTFYVNDSDLIELSNSIKKLATNQIKEMYWSVPADRIDNFYIKGFYSDGTGHICFEIFSLIPDGTFLDLKPIKPIKNHKKWLSKISNKSIDEIGLREHQVCFYIENLEPQALITFSDNLSNIKLNKKVELIHKD
ncbi:MAG: hypothetical protein ACM3O4_02455 [Ignavibacteriales bacterium]